MWHERDISHSSAERVVLPDASIALHYMIVKFTGLVRDLVVDDTRMMANLESTRGLVFSQAVLLALIDSGLGRDDAYRIVQTAAMRAWDGEGDLHSLLTADASFPLDDAALDRCFSLERILETSAPVFDRLEIATG